MTEWLMQQQGVLSVSLVMLMLSQRLLTAKLGPKLAYQLWGFVPLVLLVNNLPSTVLPYASESLTRYVVGLNPVTELTQFDVLGFVWAAGALIILVAVSYQYINLYRSIAHTASLQIANTRAYTSRIATTPMLFGFITPRILLPVGFDTRFTALQKDMILQHEHVHYQHRDHLWNLLALVLLILCWFNPLVWLALRSFRINQELACDAKVLQHKTKQEKVLYASALVLCAEQSLTNTMLYPTFGDKSTMIKRISLIKQPEQTSKPLGLIALAIASMFTANIALANLEQQPTGKQHINEATPVMRVDPVYPLEAAKQGINGSVVLQFDITETGATDNIKVIKAAPLGVFESSAVKALSQWQYKPRIQGGVAQRQSALLVQLDFLLSEDEPTANNLIEKINVAAR